MAQWIKLFGYAIELIIWAKEAAKNTIFRVDQNYSSLWGQYSVQRMSGVLSASTTNGTSREKWQQMIQLNFCTVQQSTDMFLFHRLENPIQIKNVFPKGTLAKTVAKLK